ncbi:MAG: hypothetical protein MGU50_20360 [Trichodesmium sp. MAG_R02]|nr:hypothetical protein [Trichodesmium sp. MAG_R02]
MGLHQTKNGQVGKYKTTAKVAAACEISTRRGATARFFPRAFRPRRMSTSYRNYFTRTLHTTSYLLTLPGGD